MMKSTICLLACLLAAAVDPSSAACKTKYSATPNCLTKADMPSVYHSKYTGNDICFRHNKPQYDQYGKYFCYSGVTVKEDGSSSAKMSFCNCDVSECGCGAAPAPTTPAPTVAPPAGSESCTNARATYQCSLASNSGNTVCSYCGVSSNCNTVAERGITAQADKDLIVNKHNELRQRVAAGNEAGGNPGPQPASTNMPNLVWNDDLAVGAQTWAEQCAANAHDSNRNCPGFNSVGQNKADSWSTHYDSNRKYENKIQAWYNEVNDMPASNVNAFDSGAGNGKVIGHYTQVVWAGTTQIGCGYIAWRDNRADFANYPNRQTLVCNYGNAGNYIGQAIYPTA